MKKLSFLLIACSLLAMGCARSPLSGSDTLASATGSSSSSGSAVDSSLTAQAVGILQTNCTACHTATSGPLNVYNLTDVNHLISSGLIIPGNPNASPLLQSIESGRMPPGGALAMGDQALLRNWIAGAAAAGGGGTGSTTTTTLPAPLTATYASLSKNIFVPYCTACHSAANKTAGYAFDSYSGVMAAVSVGSPNGSKVYTTTQSGAMPQSPYPQLNSSQLQVLSAWITAGAKNN